MFSRLRTHLFKLRLRRNCGKICNYLKMIQKVPVHKAAVINIRLFGVHFLCIYSLLVHAAKIFRNIPALSQNLVVKKFLLKYNGWGSPVITAQIHLKLRSSCYVTPRSIFHIWKVEYHGPIGNESQRILIDWLPIQFLRKGSLKR